MILRRLLAWLGQRSLLHQDHYGFIPGRDSTVALCTLVHDVALARSNHWFAAAVCLDIKAAYDSVWLNNLIYKLATIGVGGKMGRWIASFLQDRRIQVRWKNHTSHTGPCNQGVPQGSVLSPLLFMIYMLDIVDTLEDGVNMIVYADDILIYATGADEVRARLKLQETLRRIHRWCSANKLSLSPDKCTAINFTRCRDPGAPVKLMGFDVPWSSPIKILGLWFTRSLTFTHHFNILKRKVQRRLNYIKAVAGRSRGVNSHHLLIIIHALIRSCLEYGAPLFFDAPPSTMKILEVSYNAALRMATGLPKYTPIPVLRREAGVSSMKCRLQFMTKSFLLRILGSPPGSRFGDTLRSFLSSLPAHWKWSPPLRELLDSGPGLLSHIIRFVWPPPPCGLSFQVMAQGLPFQCCSLPPPIVASYWHSWRASLPPCSLLATDASKDVNKTAIAAVDDMSNKSVACLIPHKNSIFTAEALAICMALSQFPLSYPDVIVVTDSLSVLRALSTWSFKSPKVILLLLSIIERCNARGHTLTLVWVPGHRGVDLNERADHLAGNGPYSCNTLPLVSPEDLRAEVKKNWIIEKDYSWMNSDYATSYSFLSSVRLYPRWAPSRKADVILARWRTKTLVTHQRLYRMGLTFSPLCRNCFDFDTPEHILLHCPSLAGSRTTLLNRLNLRPPVTYEDVMLVSFASQRGICALINFSSQAFPDLM